MPAAVRAFGRRGIVFRPEGKMEFIELLKRCKGETVIINNNEERTLLEVGTDFVVLQGGNPQMKITEFIPLAHLVKLIRVDYATGSSSVSLDVSLSGGDQHRGGAD